MSYCYNCNGTTIIPVLRKELNSAPTFGDTSFTVLVGPSNDSKRFSLHKDLAISESEFFGKAFGSEWKEAKESTIPLPDHEAEHFQIFFLWLYTRRIHSSGNKHIFEPEEWDRLAGAWALGCYLQATDFQDAVTDTLIETSKQHKLRHSIHETICTNSVAGAPIRKLIVDLAVSNWDVSVLEAQSEDTACPDFFRHLSIALVKTRGTSMQAITAQASCNYHEHQKKGTPCYKSKKHGFS